MGNLNPNISIGYPFEDKCDLCDGSGVFTEEVYNQNVRYKKACEERFEEGEGDIYDDYIHIHSTKIVTTLQELLKTTAFPITCPDCNGKCKILTIQGRQAIKWVKRLKEGEWEE